MGDPPMEEEELGEDNIVKELSDKMVVGHIGRWAYFAESISKRPKRKMGSQVCCIKLRHCSNSRPNFVGQGVDDLGVLFCGRDNFWRARGLGEGERERRGLSEGLSIDK